MKTNKLSILLLVSFGMVNAAPVKTETTTTVKKETTIDAKDALAKSDLKIGFIDTFGSMRVSKEGDEASKKLELKGQELEKEITAERKKFEVAANDLNAKASTMSESARVKKNKDLEKMKLDYESTFQSSQEEMKVVMQQVTEVLAKEVDQAVTHVAKKEGLDVVIDKMTGRVIYSSDKGDYTAKVVDEMNKHYTTKVARNEKSAASSITLASNTKKSANA